MRNSFLPQLKRDGEKQCSNQIAGKTTTKTTTKATLLLGATLLGAKLDDQVRLHRNGNIV
jgi:hypothetical protein